MGLGNLTRRKEILTVKTATSPKTLRSADPELSSTVVEIEACAQEIVGMSLRLLGLLSDRGLGLLGTDLLLEPLEISQEPPKLRIIQGGKSSNDLGD